MGRRRRELSSTLERQYAQGPLEDPLTLPEGEHFLTNGALLRNRKKLVSLAVFLLIAASLLSYFIKPHAHVGDLVSPQQELPGFAAVYPGDNTLAKRVTNSYSLAFVLIEGPYTGTNVRALENIRRWAQNRFELSPNFLHPISVKSEQEPNDTIIGAVGYNLFANIKYWLESSVGSFLRARIAEFHNDPAYESFASSYFEIYGKDAEAATLLARYQSDKAKSAIDVTLWSLAWFASLTFCGFYVALSPRMQRFERMRQSLVLIWALVAVGYGCTAWMANSIPALMSALVAAVSACYFLKPFLLLTRQDSSLKVYFIQLSSRWIAFSVWASYSILAIAILTWIRCSIPDNTDPITLLLSSFSGNFLSDPEEGKHIIARVIGVVWLLISFWALRQKDKDAKVNDELEAELKSL